MRENMNVKLLSTEISFMSHVTATVFVGSKSYSKGSDPYKEIS